MKLKNILSAITKTGKTVHKSVKGSLKFMDDVLEKEYIVNAIDDVKEATGKIVEKGGELFENTKHSVESISEENNYRYMSIGLFPSCINSMHLTTLLSLVVCLLA